MTATTPRFVSPKLVPEGGDGTHYHHLPAGVTTGEIPRWDATLGQWVVASEPVALQGLVLTPAAASIVVEEGAIFYNSATKTIDVCTNAV